MASYRTVIEVAHIESSVFRDAGRAIQRLPVQNCPVDWIARPGIVTLT